MRSKTAEVLIVDDNEDFAKACVDSIESRCYVSAVYATTAQKAKVLLEELPIKVIILDQVMPTSGTELFKQLRDIDNKFKAILMSGETLNADILNIVNMGFDYGISKDPNEVSGKLPSMVLNLLIKYNTEREKVPDAPFYTEKIKKRFGKFNIEYFLADIEVLDYEYVFEDEWITRDIIEKGETIEFSYEMVYKKEFDFTSSIHFDNNASLRGNVGIGISNKAGFAYNQELSMQIKEIFDVKYTESIQNAFKRSKIKSLPSDSKEIVARVYEYAKVYWKVKLFIRKYCQCCNDNSWIIETVYLPIPTVKYRIKEYSDKEGENYKIIHSGEVKSEYRPQMGRM